MIFQVKIGIWITCFDQRIDCSRLTVFPEVHLSFSVITMYLVNILWGGNPFVISGEMTCWLKTGRCQRCSASLLNIRKVSDESLSRGEPVWLPWLSDQPWFTRAFSYCLQVIAISVYLMDILRSGILMRYETRLLRWLQLIARRSLGEMLNEFAKF